MTNRMTGVPGLGSHLGGWRNRDSWTDQVMNFDHAIEFAQAAERGKFDRLFLADGNAVRQMDKPTLFAANSPFDRSAIFESFTLMTVLSRHTRSIGLPVTATITYDESYLMARRFGPRLADAAAGGLLAELHQVLLVAVDGDVVRQ